VRSAVSWDIPIVIVWFMGVRTARITSEAGSGSARNFRGGNDPAAFLPFAELFEPVPGGVADVPFSIDINEADVRPRPNVRR
jgi:hypothetical protein